MKILLINGSPKGARSNTLRLSHAFVEGIEAHTEAELEEMIVGELDINPCLGCFSCWSKTPGSCVRSDDMQNVLDRILWADIIIWSFGLYYFSVPGPLKTLIDRLLPMALPFMEKDAEGGGHAPRYDMTGKRHIVISTCGFYTAEGNYDSVNAMFDHFLGKGGYDEITCGQGELFRVPELRSKTDAYLSIVRRAGAEFAAGSISASSKEELSELLYPRAVFEEMADASWGVEKTTGDKSDEDFSFTRQMAALYNKKAYSGKDIVLEMDYTDLGRRYQIILTKDGSEVRKDRFLPYTTRIETPYTVWRDIAAGKLSGTEAMMQRMYRVEGDFDLMLHWDDYFGIEAAKRSVPDSAKSSKKSSTMFLLLLPWIAYWVGAPIDAYYGSVAALAVCVILPLIFFRNRKTIYDTISLAAVGGFSLLTLTIGSTWLLVPLSYLGFGLMWTLSCLTKIPLTAHYSMNDYNGDEALKNPLFIRTNLILTLAWGVLYLITSVWTFFLMQSEVSFLTAIINNILPIMMGIFTAWFQKWYPAHYAASQ
ncbi:NAD(P)H-dependent oxidoreductase [uncultured Ruminococcus sp.]|uniref:NAD(P)H-dependent oxidoreductase n=1 Tax=uncultured Ruminococcus sp. TaxID=165186 RepID=UPI00292ECE35|nr:NAD(P)H-dependent oxidoreductase [uncultured Ruminococcus sp.]